MRIRTLSDATATLVAWSPVILLLAFVTWGLITGVSQLEQHSWGTEYFVDNPAGPSPWEEYHDMRQEQYALAEQQGIILEGGDPAATASTDAASAAAG